MVKIPSGEWTLECDGALFAVLQRDKEFTFLLVLARCVNVLKFAMDVHPNAEGPVTPSTERQRFGAYLSLAGSVHELLDLRDRMKREWSGLTAYHEVFSVFDPSRLDSKTVEMLRRVRNRAAFHFDPSIPQSVLPKLPAESFAFLSAFGNSPFESNYELADLVTVGYLFDSPTDMHRLQERNLEFLENLRAVAIAFVKKADSVILGRLLERGLRIVEHRDGTFVADRTP